MCQQCHWRGAQGADGERDGAAGRADRPVIAGDGTGGNAFAVLVPLLAEDRQEVFMAPLAALAAAGIATEQLQDLDRLDHGRSSGIPNEDRVGIHVAVVSHRLERAIRQGEQQLVVAGKVDCRLGAGPSWPRAEGPKCVQHALQLSVCEDGTRLHVSDELVSPGPCGRFDHPGQPGDDPGQQRHHMPWRKLLCRGWLLQGARVRTCLVHSRLDQAVPVTYRATDSLQTKGAK
jgi:hypothetical protein